MIAIDASSLAKFLLKEKGWSNVRSLLETRSPLYSVDLIVKEVSNVLWKHAKVTKVIDEARAHLLFKALMELVKGEVIVLEPEVNYLERAYVISLTENVAVYDSLYIALAEKLGELATSDRVQAGIAAKHGVKTLFIP
ncbi:MAG: type II toxin-antitoxin system VapC family toxin [Candidatus Jordarchaeales archaeon]|nr:type II toxin-antitoxin system VapC family toxin [Candidatus Jordarchaeia archaeon]